MADGEFPPQGAGPARPDEPAPLFEAQSTTVIRPVFLIDPRGIVRATLAFPISVGRSVAELLRLVEGLQVTAEGEHVAPEGWRSGEPLLAAAPRTSAVAAQRRDPLCYAGGAP